MASTCAPAALPAPAAAAPPTAPRGEEVPYVSDEHHISGVGEEADDLPLNWRCPQRSARRGRNAPARGSSQQEAEL